MRASASRPSPLFEPVKREAEFLMLFDRALRTTAVAALLALPVGAALTGPASSHTPLFSCYDNYDGTLFCEGGFSDGSSAAGVGIRVIADGETVFESALDGNSTLEFDKPSGDYTVIFDAGPGHVIEVQSGNIE